MKPPIETAERTEVIEQAACVVHEAVRGLGLSRGEVDIATWQIAPEQIKNGFRSGVRQVLAARAEAPYVSARQVHETFRERELRKGWSYGPEWDASKRESPMLRTWEELPECNRFSYTLLVQIAGCWEGRTEAVK